jgi:HlyD family secretion protein
MKTNASTNELSGAACPPRAPSSRRNVWSACAVVPLLLGLGLAGCAPETPGSYQGYLEGEFVYVASPLAGTLTNLAVSRGAEVKAGQLLYVLESEAEAAATREAEERLAQAQARLDDLHKGRRPTELAALEAQLRRANASLALSELELQRRVRLRETNVISAEELDAARTRRDTDQAELVALSADLETARLGARVDEIKAAEADVQALTAALGKARWTLAQKTQRAPADAWVHDTLYRQGEFVAAGNPVISLLPPENVKARFFVPQKELATLRSGQSVWVSFDGAATPYVATVNYIATEAEFTPPVIYSKENRAKLVYMVEAAFAAADARKLRPGQPVDVRVTP